MQKTIIVGILANVFGNGKYLKSIFADSKIVRDKIMQNIGQNKRYWCTNNIKMKNNKFKTIRIKDYFDGIIKLEDFDFDNILIDEKSHKNILIYDILSRTLIGPKPLSIRFDKIDGLIRIYDGNR